MNETILNHCKRQKIKLTPIREHIINIISNKKIPCGAYEILETLKLQKQNAEPMTVYRTLNFLVANNIVHKLEAQKKYALCCHPDHDTCQICICKKCNRKYEFHDQQINTLLKTILKDSGFELSGKIIELYGYCKNCKESSELDN